MNAVQLDACSAKSAWKTYPQGLFPRLWKWQQEQPIVMARANFRELQNGRNSELVDWLVAKLGLVIIESDMQIIRRAEAIKNELGIRGGNYSQKGVSGPDLFAIATAAVYGNILITEERVQRQTPKEQKLRNYRIPAVCKRFAKQVQTCNFCDWMVANYPGEIADYEQQPYVLHEKKEPYKVTFKAHKVL